MLLDCKPSLTTKVAVFSLVETANKAKRLNLTHKCFESALILIRCSHSSSQRLVVA